MQAMRATTPHPRCDLAARFRATLAAGLVAAILSLGTGMACFGALTATASVAAGGLGVAHDACQRVEATLAADLGLSVAALQAITPAQIEERIATRQGMAPLATGGMRRTTERATAYAHCRQAFGPTAVVPDSE